MEISLFLKICLQATYPKNVCIEQFSKNIKFALLLRRVLLVPTRNIYVN
jgi:hypothetical protein